MLSRLSVLLVAIAFVAAACSADPTFKDVTAGAGLTTSTTLPGTTTTVTTLPPDATTVTTYPAEWASPLNGLKATDSLLLDRRAVAVKVDNHPLARPQFGLDTADAVLETIVEAGLTRFIALFHDDDADQIGPIRSLRPTDTGIVAPIGAPLAISGGQPWVQSLAVQRGVRLIGETQGYFRASGRRAPHNLFADTLSIRRTADQRGWPDDRPTGLFDIDTWTIPAEEATEIVLDWSDVVTVRWLWDPEAGVYTRWHGSEPHQSITADGTTEQVTAQVLIVLSGTQHLAYPPGGTGSAVPAIETRGYGRAWVFAVGRVWTGTWLRDDFTDHFRLRADDGTIWPAPAGIPWISFFPLQRSVTYE